MPFGARDNKFKSNIYKSSMHMIFCVCICYSYSPWPETNIMKTKFKNEKYIRS